MKMIKWKSLILTSAACLIPIILGIAVYAGLPESIAIHFDINNQPDGFASRSFAVFGLPLIMMLMQAFCCVVSDINAAKKGVNKKFELVMKSIIPIMTAVVYVATIAFALGNELDIRRVAVFLVGAVFIALGNYLPKLNYVNQFHIGKSIRPKNPKKFNRIAGYGMVIFGAFFLASLFFPPVFSVAALILLVPFTVAVLILSVKI